MYDNLSINTSFIIYSRGADGILIYSHAKLPVKIETVQYNIASTHIARMWLRGGGYTAAVLPTLELL